MDVGTVGNLFAPSVEMTLGPVWLNECPLWASLSRSLLPTSLDPGLLSASLSPGLLLASLGLIINPGLLYPYPWVEIAAAAPGEPLAAGTIAAGMYPCACFVCGN